MPQAAAKAISVETTRTNAPLVGCSAALAAPSLSAAAGVGRALATSPLAGIGMVRQVWFTAIVGAGLAVGAGEAVGAGLAVGAGVLTQQASLVCPIFS